LFVVGYGLLALAWAMAMPALGASGGPDGTLRGERLGHLAIWLLCVALATILAWRPSNGSLSLAGVAVALTPAVVFLGGTAGDDGLVLAAGLALIAGLLRLAGGAVPAADPDRGRATAVSAAGSRRAPLWTWAATALAALLLVLAGLRLPGDFGADPLSGAWHALGPALAAASGRFATSAAVLPPLGYAIWAIALLALVLAADRRTDDRGRRLLWLGSLLAVVAALLLFAAARREDGSAPVARHALVLLAFVPLLAGELLSRSGARWWSRLAAGCFGLLGLVQVLGFVVAYDETRAGGGTSPWLGAVLLGALALAAAGALGAQPAQAEPGTDGGKPGGNGGA
jgi:hypothetical protein